MFRLCGASLLFRALGFRTLKGLGRRGLRLAALFPTVLKGSSWACRGTFRL